MGRALASLFRELLGEHPPLCGFVIPDDCVGRQRYASLPDIAVCACVASEGVQGDVINGSIEAPALRAEQQHNAHRFAQLSRALIATRGERVPTGCVLRGVGY
jgi:hypothetical protein